MTQHRHLERGAAIVLVGHGTVSHFSPAQVTCIDCGWSRVTACGRRVSFDIANTFTAVECRLCQQSAAYRAHTVERTLRRIDDGT